jgi:hypothetical protein
MIRAFLGLLAFAVAGQGADLSTLLGIAAKAAEREIVALSSVACTETLTETKLNLKDKTEERRRQTFDYLVLVDTDDGGLAVTESRVEQGSSKKTEAKPLLASTGFATMMLILHPYYQNSFAFSDLGTAEQDGRTWRRLGFTFQPGKRSPSILRSGAQEFALAWQGEALLDEATGQVVSIHASIGSQLEEIGIVSLDATVHFAPASGDSGQWLPAEAVIDLKTQHQHWRNVHTFSNYKHFEVTTTEKKASTGQKETKPK